jgi:hypothetical protein
MYSLKQAADATGKTKPTILKAIQNGRISAKRKENGEWEIDPAELHRVYEPVSVNGSGNGEGLRSETPNETAVLRREVDLLREQLERERDTIADLRRRLDDEATERRKLTMLLTHQKEQEPTKTPEAPATHSPLWQKLFGRGWAS